MLQLTWPSKLVVYQSQLEFNVLHFRKKKLRIQVSKARSLHVLARFLSTSTGTSGSSTAPELEISPLEVHLLYPPTLRLGNQQPVPQLPGWKMHQILDGRQPFGPQQLQQRHRADAKDLTIRGTVLESWTGRPFWLWHNSRFGLITIDILV